MRFIIIWCILFIIFSPTCNHCWGGRAISVRLRLQCDGTRAETRFRLSAKRTSPFKSAGSSVQSTTGSRGVHINGSNAGYTMFRGSVKSTGYPLFRQFPLHFPSRASPCAITFQLDSMYSVFVCVCVCVCKTLVIQLVQRMRRVILCYLACMAML